MYFCNVMYFTLIDQTIKKIYDGEFALKWNKSDIIERGVQSLYTPV
jgi:hypothetical protein